MEKATLLLLLATASALNSYTLAVTQVNTDLYSIHYLGNLTSGDIISFLIEFPNASTGSAPTSFTPKILDNSLLQLTTQPAGFGNNVLINFAGSNTLSWNVGSSGVYSFKITSSTTASLVPFKLTVSNGGTQILKLSDSARSFWEGIIYLSSNQATWNVTKNSSIVALSQLYPITSNVYGSRVASSSSGNTMIFSNLAAGYYVFKFLTIAPLSITYHSDPYPCPYDPAFPDVKGIFRPCLNYTAPVSPSSPSSESGMPVRTKNIIIIASCCGALAIAVAGFIVFKLKSGPKGEASEEKNEDSSCNGLAKGSPNPIEPNLEAKNIEIVKVERA